MQEDKKDHLRLLENVFNYILFISFDLLHPVYLGLPVSPPCLVRGIAGVAIGMGGARLSIRCHQWLFSHPF